MNLETDFSPADPGETQDYSMSFEGHIADGDSISGAVWSLAVVSTVTGYAIDAVPMSRISGPAVTNPATPKITSQRIAGLQAGNRYRVQATVTTVNGEVVSNYSHVHCLPLA